MSNFNNYSCQTGRVHLMQLQGLWRHVMVVLAVFLFTSNYASAQITFPAPNTKCVSNDMQVISATLGENCVSCTTGNDLLESLVLTVKNTTGSTRRSFTYWARVEVTNPDGTVEDLIEINGCEASPWAGGETRKVTGVKIPFDCGSTIRLIDVFLAWTDAPDSDRSTCDEMLANPNSINPKCGRPAEIQVTTPPATPLLTAVQPTCTVATGGITIAATAGLTFSLDGGAYAAYPAGGWSGLAAGAHTVTAKNAAGCVSSPATITLNPQPATPAAPVLSIVNDCESSIITARDGAGVLISAGELIWSNGASGNPITVTATTAVTATRTNGICVSGNSNSVTRVPENCVAYQGCTLGYWKNHPGSWTCPEYQPTTMYNTVFIVPTTSPLYNLTLMQALNLTGGGIYNLGRQSVAALLNACHSAVNYELSVRAVIEGANLAIRTGTAGAYAGYLDRLNNAGCSIDAHGRPILTATSSSALKGIETLEGIQLTAYPTPFADKATIEFRFVKDEKYTINLYDMKGSVVKQLKAGTARAGEVNQVEVDGRSLPEGLYIARMMSDSGVKTVKLLLKKQ